IAAARLATSPSVFLRAPPSPDLSPLSLHDALPILDAVVVVKQKPLIEQKIDRMVVNVGASLTSGGSNALEVLEKAPGVVVDQDRSEEHTSELQSRENLVCRLLLEKKKKKEEEKRAG